MQFKKLLLVFLLHLSFLQLTNAQTVKIQFINNCPDVSVSSVDIYINGSLLVDNLNFRTATAFVDYNLLPPNMLTVGIAPATSLFITDTFANFNLTVNASNPNVIIIDGVKKSSGGYSPDKKISLDILSAGKIGALTPSNTDYIFFNGSTDMTTFDVKTGLTTLADDISYGNYSPSYLSVTTGDFKIRLTNSSQSTTINTYNANFGTQVLGNNACVILTSGFVNPANNNNGPAFGLWLAKDGGGPLVQLTSTTPEAIDRVQFINNCSDKTADTVDVYIDGVLTFDNFAIHTATPFTDYVAKVPMSIAVAPKNSTSVADAFYTSPVSLDSGKRYIFVANGIRSATGYTPLTSYVLSSYKFAQEDAASSANTDIVFMNGSTDAGTVDIKQGASPLFTATGYPVFDGYKQVPTANIILTATVNAVNTDYEANLTTLGLQGKAVTLVSSGFVNTTANSKGPAFGLYLATAQGGLMTKLPVYLSVPKTNGVNKLFNVSPNPATTSLHITAPANAKIATADVLDITGKVVAANVTVNNNNIDIAALNSGVYILHFNYDAEAVSLRFVKQ